MARKKTTPPPKAFKKPEPSKLPPRGKSKSVADDDLDDLDELDTFDDEPAPGARDFADDEVPRPSANNAYTGLVLVATLALAGAAALHYADYTASSKAKLDVPTVALPALITTPQAPAPAAKS